MFVNISGVNAVLQNHPDAISANRDGLGTDFGKIPDHPQIRIHVQDYDCSRLSVCKNNTSEQLLTSMWIMDGTESSGVNSRCVRL